MNDTIYQNAQQRLVNQLQCQLQANDRAAIRKTAERLRKIRLRFLKERLRKIL